MLICSRHSDDLFYLFSLNSNARSIQISIIHRVFKLPFASALKKKNIQEDHYTTSNLKKKQACIYQDKNYLKHDYSTDIQQLCDVRHSTQGSTLSLTVERGARILLAPDGETSGRSLRTEEAESRAQQVELVRCLQTRVGNCLNFFVFSSPLCVCVRCFSFQFSGNI